MNPLNKQPSRLTLKDQQQDIELFRQRATFAGGFVLVALGLLLLRYGWLQLFQHEQYVTQSENNRIQLEAIAPPRGFIYDRNGVLLADNRPVFALVLAWLLLDQAIAPLQLVGALIVVGAVVALGMRRKR